MFAKNQNYFNDFFRQPKSLATQAVEDLWQVKSSLLDTKLPFVQKLYTFVDPIYVLLAEQATTERLWPMDLAMFGLLDADLVKEFVADPKKVENQEVLTESLILICAAVGRSTWLEPYDKGELVKVILNQADFFAPDDMAATLHSIAEGVEYTEKMPYLLTMLQDGLADKAMWQVKLDWGVVLLHAAMLHTVWNFFAALNDSDQQMLVHNFLYQSIVAGVPVKERILEAIEISDAGKLVEAKRLYDALKNAQELVPVKTDWTEFRGVAYLVHSAEAEVLDVSSSALAHDQYARKIYANQDGRDVYGSWLRELFIVADMLKKESAKSGRIR